jgi:hypothetical protein
MQFCIVPGTGSPPLLLAATTVWCVSGLGACAGAVVETRGDGGGATSGSGLGTSGAITGGSGSFSSDSGMGAAGSVSGTGATPMGASGSATAGSVGGASGASDISSTGLMQQQPSGCGRQ